MNKIKIASIVVVGLLIGIGSFNFAGAVALTGRVEAEVNSWVGVVTPDITLDNQSITFQVNVTDDEGNITYIVEDELYIELNSTDNSGREQFIMPRSVFYSVIATRNMFDVGLLPIMSIFNRMFPIRELIKSKNVVDSMLGGEKDTNITIPVNYEISEETFNAGENLTVHICAMGLMPGETNGLSSSIPVIVHKVITLEISYEDMAAPLP